MSLSKGELPAADAEPPRRPKCTRCRHHGFSVQQKGHTKICPFLECACPKCTLVTERTRILALQRNLRRAERNKHKNQPKRTCTGTGDGDGGAEPAAHRACGASAPAGGARPSGTSHLSNVTESSVSSVTTAWNPLDLRSGPAAGGECAAGPDSTDAEGYAPTEVRGNITPFNIPYFGELRPSAPVHFIHFPFRMSGHYPSSCAPYPAFMFNVPFLPPVPAGLYNHGLYRPLRVPHYQQGALHIPAVTEPGPSPVFSLQPPLLPESSQKEPVSTWPPEPPLANQAAPDIVELD